VPAKEWSIAGQLDARDRSAVQSKALRWVAASVALLAVAEAALIGYLMLGPSSTQAASETQVVVESPQPGAEVVVDGRTAGVTPLMLKVGSGTRSIQVLNRKPVATGSRPLGGLKLSAPIELTVFEGEKMLGSSTGGPIMLSPGRHTLDLVNGPIGYAARRIVQVTAGEIRTIVVTPSNGKISINASPSAEVSVDGRPVGGTPLANLSVPVGEHEIVFRHPNLGERRLRALVRSDRPTQLSVSFRQ
jgi:hypothetical protein